MKKFLAALALVALGVGINHGVELARAAFKLPPQALEYVRCTPAGDSGGWCLQQAAFQLNVPQGPSLGDNFVNPYTLAKAINEGNQRQATAGLTAKAGGGQTSATQLVLGINEVSVVATAADSVQLPACVPGTMVFVVNNDASDSMTVYSKEGRTDTINGTAGATGVAQAAAARAWYVCISTASVTQGAWVTLRASS